MTIGEMHVMFRELAQQMGMQTTRAILPENIDICLNIAIKDTVKELIAENIGYVNPNDKISRHDNAISSINGLRTLMKKGNVDIKRKPIDNVLKPETDVIKPGNGTPKTPFAFSITNNDVMLYLGFKVTYDSNLLYDCRIIEQENLGSTVQDFSNRPTKDAPICTIIKSNDDFVLELINGLNNGTLPSSIQYLYIANPAEVYYDEENSNNTDCDLPNYLHKDIVEKAVSVYLQSVGAIRNTNK